MFDMIGVFVKNWWWNVLGGLSVYMLKVGNGEVGFVFGFGCGDVILLELFFYLYK